MLPYPILLKAGLRPWQMTMAQSSDRSDNKERDLLDVLPDPESRRSEIPELRHQLPRLDKGKSTLRLATTTSPLVALLRDRSCSVTRCLGEDSTLVSEPRRTTKSDLPGHASSRSLRPRIPIPDGPQGSQAQEAHRRHPGATRETRMSRRSSISVVS